MLNISLKRINENINLDRYQTFAILKERKVSQVLIKIIGVTVLISILSMFLPWTQNIRTKGNVTTMNPDDRPQTVQSIIGGKIEDWYVQEGQLVAKGDTIMRISEVKEDYFDPEILDNTNSQILAKKESSKAYNQKANNLNAQLKSLIKNKVVKLEQNQIKVEQTKLKITSDSIELIAAKTKLDIAGDQLKRIEKLYNDGLKSLTELESKQLSIQESQAKVTGLINKLANHRNELASLNANINAIENDFDNKIAKSKSERMSALSAMYDANASQNKLQSQFNAYSTRQDNYFILSPIDGTVTEAIKTGLGELIKAGDAVAKIIPTKYNLAIESYISPMDMPLVRIGQKVRVQFDGWPAIVFSGWPNSSYGTFGGKIFAINNDISKNGKYRIMIAPDEEDQAWPEEVRIGGGTNSIMLLNEVKVGYELWRQLNGFPADFYKNEKQKNIKTKAPLRKVK